MEYNLPSEIVKDLNFGENAKNKVIAGVDKLAQAVKSTLGASGKCVIYEDGRGKPVITKDGVTVAQSVVLYDPVENIGATLIKEAAQNTVKEAGDGTTTATVLAQSLLKEAERGIKTCKSVREVKNGLKSAADKVNKYLDKITNLIEKFQLNVAIASIYEIVRYMEESLKKSINNQHFKKHQINLMKAIMPFMPHLSCECLSKLEGNNFYSNIQWPKIEKALLLDDKVIIVIQVNGKKRGLVSVKKDIEEKDLVEQAKKIENIEKNLKNKKIIRKIFVKNKIINFITT